MDDGRSVDRSDFEPAAPVDGEREHSRLEALRRAPEPTPPGERSEPMVPPAAAVAAAPPAATAEPSAASPARRKRGLLRPLLFAVLPVTLAAGGYFYVTGGRFMSSDNAYVQADMVGIFTDVAGTVTSVEVRDNQVVKQGQVLFRLRQAPFTIALDGARAQLGAARDQILTLKAKYVQAQAEVGQAEAELSYYQTEFDRQQNLARSGAASKAAFDQANQNLVTARQKITVAKAEADSAKAELGGDPEQPVERNPAFLQAKAGVDDAQRQLDDSVVRAPFDGIVTNVPALQVGSYLNAAQQAFSLVSSDHVWVAASPKETELTNVASGQPVTVTVDTYPGIEWKGRVGSISPASGSSFSLLPAQNTTGNWVKVVQRIPMIVDLAELADKPPLRVGMSVTVTVDTGRARGLPTFVTDLVDRAERARG